jgi:hypothetical protein
MNVADSGVSQAGTAPLSAAPLIRAGMNPAISAAPSSSRTALVSSQAAAVADHKRRRGACRRKPHEVRREVIGIR